MEQLTQNLRGVAVYFDDILVSGDNAKDHLMNLRALFKRLEEKGLRCNREKSVFAQVSIDYLGHTLSSRGIAKGSKVDAIKSFLASVQFYSKFLPPYFSKITEIKRLLCTETVLAHYDPSLLLGLSCDASECGIGAVLCSVLKAISSYKYTICGDINIDLLKWESNIQTSDYINELYSAGAVLAIDKPTRLTNTLATLIDHIYTNNLLNNVPVGILIYEVSDHLPVYIVFKDIITQKQQNHVYRDIKNLRRNV